MKQASIPTHDFYDKLERTIPFDFHLLKEKGSYDPSVPHRHSYYEVFFFLNGGGTHEIDFEAFPIESNVIHFVSPGQVHMVQRALDSNGYVLLFSREFYYLGLQNKDTLYDLPFLNGNTRKPIIKLKEAEVGQINNMFQNIQSECFSENGSKEEILRTYLKLLLLHAKRLYEADENNTPKATGTGSELISKFKIAVEQHFLLLHKVNEYAEMLCVTPGHLNDTAQKILGTSAGDFIHERIILEAKRILVHSDETVQEIALLLNFEDPSYFNRFFKKNTGASPSEFRVKIREKYH